MYIRNKKGYTLIEMLVVVLVISALSGLVINIINTQNFYGKARDSQRAADLKRIQTALELYFSDYRCYPASEQNNPLNPCAGTGRWMKVDGGANDDLTPELVPDYIQILPIDPQDGGTNRGPCGSNQFFRYNYVTATDGSAYVLTATMEIDTSDDNHECENDVANWNSVGWGEGWCGGGVSTECYGVENP